jgi:hypothetical protein
MDIKLILENQLAIMQWLAEAGFSDPTTLNAQIQKTKERIESWVVPTPPSGFTN